MMILNRAKEIHLNLVINQQICFMGEILCDWQLKFLKSKRATAMGLIVCYSPTLGSLYHLLIWSPTNAVL